MKLIDKDALVTEIEKRKIIAREKAEIASDNNNVPVAALWSGKENICSDLLSFLDTIEVKEVDLEKYYHDFLQKEWFDKNCNRTISEMMVFTAKHFFELGLKAQKGE